jgi:Fe-S-cluster-containing dehydrogenase component
MLENSWEIHARNVYTYNSEASASLPLVNISLACNHCEKPVCLLGCPSAAYSSDSATGAIIIDENKCIGCRYCQWNCPYDAPKFDSETRVIGKCNLCYKSLVEGREPACSSGCPTGALAFGFMNENKVDDFYTWFPDKKLNPGIQFEGPDNSNPLEVIPKYIFSNTDDDIKPAEKVITSDLSLIVFSFLAVLSVSYVVVSLLNGSFPITVLLIFVIMLTAGISLFHLGRKPRAWRAIFNFKKSPLSREIAFFTIFAISSITSTVMKYPVLLVFASVSGLVFLISIDNVYIFADNRKKMILHSGQTFLTGLLIIAFATGNVIPFIFIALLKAASAFYNIFINIRTGIIFVLRFLRLVILFMSAGSIINGNFVGYNIALIFFLTGEFFERIIFYVDFEPVNINNSILKHQIFTLNEKKRN